MADLVASLRLFVLTLFVCSGAYPAAVLLFAELAAPESRHGSLLRDAHGTVRGSRLLAQKITQPGYFHPRPSACDYDAAAAAGSNLSPTNPALAHRAAKIIAAQGAGRANHPVPADLVLASGSGLDPHISLAAALYQVPRVARARALPEEEVRALVLERAETSVPTVLGRMPLVNVLELNLALDGRDGRASRR